MYRIFINSLLWSTASKLLELPNGNGNGNAGDGGDGTCGYTTTIVNGKSSCKGKQVFSEDFHSLDSARWKNVVQFGYKPVSTEI